MPTSKRWKGLTKDIGKLRRHFLPATFDPLGTYPNSDRVQSHTRAFLVLSHAEIETYLEEWAKEIARASEVLWASPTKKITEPLAFLLATHSERIAVPTTLVGVSVKDSPQRLADMSVKLYQKYYKQIKDNHGIKETNLLTLFAPLGIPASALGLTLLPNLDSLGDLRGKHAHYSAKAVQNMLDPETEYKRVTDLVNELMGLDTWLVIYKRRIR